MENFNDFNSLLLNKLEKENNEEDIIKGVVGVICSD